MASVAYGPEAIVLVLAAAGAHGLGFTLPVTLAIAALLAVLVASYRQVIAAFPDGGGSYAVAKTHLGARTSLVAAASLVLDYVLNVAVAVTAGVAALTSAFPELYDERLWLCLAVLVLITGGEPARDRRVGEGLHRADGRLRRLDPRAHRGRAVPVRARQHRDRRRSRLRARGQRHHRRRPAPAEGFRLRVQRAHRRRGPRQRRARPSASRAPSGPSARRSPSAPYSV